MYSGYLVVNLVLILTLMIVLAAALPWFPYSPSAKSRHPHQQISLMDTASRATGAGTKCGGQESAPVASQKAAMKLDKGSETSIASTLAYIPLAVSLFLLWILDTETWLQRALLLSLALTSALFFSAIFSNRKKPEFRKATRR